MATIKEHSLTLPGVEIVETSTRSYEQGDIPVSYTHLDVYKRQACPEEFCQILLMS